MLVGLVAADVFVRARASSEVESQVAARTRGSAGVSASVGRPGMLASVLVAGRVGPVHLHLDRLQAEDVEVLDVDVDFVGVVIDRSGALNGQVRVIEVDAVELRFGLDGAALSRLADVPVEVADGKVRATVEGTAVEVLPHLEDRTLVLSVRGAGRISVPLPASELLPCAGGLTVEGNLVRMACTARPVPDELVRRLSR